MGRDQGRVWFAEGALEQTGNAEFARFEPRELGFHIPGLPGENGDTWPLLAHNGSVGSIFSGLRVVLGP